MKKTKIKVLAGYRPKWCKLSIPSAAIPHQRSGVQGTTKERSPGAHLPASSLDDRAAVPAKVEQHEHPTVCMLGVRLSLPSIVVFNSHCVWKE